VAIDADGISSAGSAARPYYRSVRVRESFQDVLDLAHVAKHEDPLLSQIVDLNLGQPWD
jgi:hypothetical protein